MINGKANLTIDLGNSGLRAFVVYGTQAQGGHAVRERISLSNKFASISEDYVLPEDYSEKDSCIFKSCNIMLEGGVEVSGRYITGKARELEFSSESIRPTALEKKYNLKTTVLSIQRCLIEAHRVIMEKLGVAVDDMSISWNITVLLPPGDVDAGKSKIAEIVQNITELTVEVPNWYLPVSIDKVSVLPEGFCALVACIFEPSEKGNTIRPESKYLLTDTVLIVDIGAGTTDFLIAKDGQAISATRRTVNKGGNNVTQSVKGVLRKKGIEVLESDLEEGVISGKVRDGASYQNISALVKVAKKALAQQLIGELTSYFEDISYPPRSIGAVLICGGGAISSEASSAVGDILFDELKKLSPKIARVEIPTEKIKHFGVDGSVSSVEEVTISPRELNSVGASILSGALA